MVLDFAFFRAWDCGYCFNIIILYWLILTINLIIFSFMFQPEPLEHFLKQIFDIFKVISLVEVVHRGPISGKHFLQNIFVFLFQGVHLVFDFLVYTFQVTLAFPLLLDELVLFQLELLHFLAKFFVSV